MGALMVISLALTFFMGLPALTYMYAKHLGRRPWLWFTIGVILPGFATIILSFLPEIKQEGNND